MDTNPIKGKIKEAIELVVTESQNLEAHKRKREEMMKSIEARTGKRSSRDKELDDQYSANAKKYFKKLSRMLKYLQKARDV